MRDFGWGVHRVKSKLSKNRCGCSESGTSGIRQQFTLPSWYLSLADEYSVGDP